MHINREATFTPAKRRKMLDYTLDQLGRADGFENGLELDTEVVEGLTIEELIGTCVAFEDELEHPL